MPHAQGTPQHDQLCDTDHTRLRSAPVQVMLQCQPDLLFAVQSVARDQSILSQDISVIAPVQVMLPSQPDRQSAVRCIACECSVIAQGISGIAPDTWSLSYSPPLQRSSVLEDDEVEPAANGPWLHGV